MSYWSTTQTPDGQQVPYHVNARDRCKTCRVPVGVGTCARCTKFAHAMEELVQAAYRQDGAALRKEQEGKA